MKKVYLATKQVREFIADQPDETQAEYLKIAERLEQDGYLIEPFAKKLNSQLFEFRIRRGQQVRVFYCYQGKDYVIGLHGFVKKTQHTPQRELEQAMRVLRKIKGGEYEE